MKLIKTSYCTDGGSMGAEFEMDDGAPFKVFLEISPTANKRIHRRLFSCLPNVTAGSRPIVKNSPEEAVILKVLEDWVSSNVSPAEQMRIESHKLEYPSDFDVFWIIELITAIKQREPEPNVGSDG